MSRQGGLVHLSLDIHALMVGVVIEAMRKGYCDKLQVLEIRCDHCCGRPPALSALTAYFFLALAHGLCPKINKLVVPDCDDLLRPLSAALSFRMKNKDKGCCGLKSLEIRKFVNNLSPLLSSGACEALEELRVAGLPAFSIADEEFCGWLTRTKAPKLRVLESLFFKAPMAQALCTPGVAPRLQVLKLIFICPDAVQLLSQALGGGAWPHLRQLRLQNCSINASRLLEAIGVGARELISLELGGLLADGGVAVARMLNDGGCPQLEKLDLRYGHFNCDKIDDAAVVELARALEGDAPCNTTLRQLKLRKCRYITYVGVRELAGSMGRGALPHLEYLDLSDSSGIMDDGVVALSQAMATGALCCLRHLDLREVGMERNGAAALFQAFRDNDPCPHLNVLDIGHNFIGNSGVVYLAEAIESGALQYLQSPALCKVGMGEEGFKALIKAVVVRQPSPGCPRLEILNVSRNKDIGDGGVMHLAEAMKVEKRAMQHLRVINLGGLDLTIEGARALSHSIRSTSVCPHLEDLWLSSAADGDRFKFLKEAARKRRDERGRDRLQVEVSSR